MQINKRIPLRKVDERQFKHNEHLVWASRLEARETGETIGVRVKVLFGKFATSPNDYFTDDNGKTFRHVSVFLSVNPESMIDMMVGDAENDPPLLAVLTEVFAKWQHAILNDVAL
jgi:hypothetical protein